MDSTTKKGITISKLTIGTVQFGIPYGLKEDAKATVQDEVNSTLSAAIEQGITSIDTAAAYGDSESKIGNWYRSIRNTENITVCTKIHNLDLFSEKSLICSMRSKVDESGQKLRLKEIPIVMIHHFQEYIERKKWFDHAFAILKEEGRIRFGGVSAYSTDDYFLIADSGLDTVQIPVNILDWRQIDNQGLKQLHDAGMIVFARSIYLQGLLLRSPEQLSNRMDFAKDTIKKYMKLCKEMGLSPLTLAMSFVNSLPEITSLVVGCRNKEQLLSNCKALSGCIMLNEEQMDQIHDLFVGTEEKVIVPMLWPH